MNWTSTRTSSGARRWLPFAALGLWGIWAFLPKLALETVRPATTLLWELAAGVLLALAVAFVHRHHTGEDAALARTAKPSALAACGAGVCGYGGILAYTLALAELDAHRAALLTGMYPALALVAGVLLFKERLSALNWLGVALANVVCILLFLDGLAAR